jgi:predicted O-methyltransferase YrrM
MTTAETILDELKRLPQTWHDSGPLDDNVLQALADTCSRYGRVLRSVETGAGKSTLFFSHVSRNHTVFAIDIGNSLTRVRESSLLKSEVVEFVEGPTQQTVPQYTFDEKLDIVLIDGPHGYPFPDLEYYYFYPHIAEGGILIIDDINIPSIRRMVEIVKSDAMFECQQIIGKTMFLKRTSAPVFDPLADGWWDQEYNKLYLRKTEYLEKIKRSMPQAVFNLIPTSLRLKIQKYL